jgi:hypothetical protein
LPYGESEPRPADAPVAPPELIGASLFLGLVAVVSISTHGSYLVSLLLGRAVFNPAAVAGLFLNATGFVASLWLLALRRWAWVLAIVFAVAQVGLRAYLVLITAAPGLVGRKYSVDVGAVARDALLGLVFLVVLAYITSVDARDLIKQREHYRST